MSRYKINYKECADGSSWLVEAFDCEMDRSGRVFVTLDPDGHLSFFGSAWLVEFLYEWFEASPSSDSTYESFE